MSKFATKWDIAQAGVKYSPLNTLTYMLRMLTGHQNPQSRQINSVQGRSGFCKQWSSRRGGRNGEGGRCSTSDGTPWVRSTVQRHLCGTMPVGRLQGLQMSSMQLYGTPGIPNLASTFTRSSLRLLELNLGCNLEVGGSSRQA